ncbi:MAG: type II toxin-antitoxin system death-on-curing family toxin [Lentisphaeria bacterium]|nr:type II toxin-antitoxin system death-on-curing family toxin [Lentisphaeria bacterium]
MTSSPIFLTLSDVVEIHAYQLEHFGGIQGICDLGLLKSVVAMPMASFGEIMLHKDIYEMSAAYLFHIVNNHPFVDGNKRTGVMAALVFLDINEIGFNASDKELTDMVLRVASGQMHKLEIASFLKAHGVCLNS